MSCVFFFFFFLLKCDDRKHDFAVNRAVESETRLKVAKWNLDIFHIPFLIWWLNHFHTHLFPLSLSVLVVPNKRTGASCARHICRLYSLSLSLTFAVCLCYWLIVDWLRKAEIKHERIQAIATSLRTHEQENKLFFQIVCFLPDFVESRIFVQRPIHVSVDCFFLVHCMWCRMSENPTLMCVLMLWNQTERIYLVCWHENWIGKWRKNGKKHTHTQMTRHNRHFN